MSDTLPNIVVPASTIVDLYAESGISVGTQLDIKMFGTGIAKLYAGATLTQEPDNSTGYRPIVGGDEMSNDSGDSGAFIWSTHGCTVNVSRA